MCHIFLLFMFCFFLSVFYLLIPLLSCAILIYPFVYFQITAADLHFFAFMDIITDHEEFSGILDPYPALKGHVGRIRNQPKLKKYLESRKKTTV